MGVRIIVLMFAGALAWPGGVSAAAQWTIETVDTSGAGYYTSMKADSTGNLHVAYVPEVNGHPLKYAFWDKAVKRWFTMQVAANASFSTLVLDSKEHPQISFVDFGTGQGCKVRRAAWDGTWKVDPIDVRPGAILGYYTSIALNQKDEPILTYYDYANPSGEVTLQLGSLIWSGNYWAAVMVDRTRGSGKFNSIAIDSSGRPQIAYANVSYETDSLRYATWDGKVWKVEIIEGANGPFPVYSVSMVLDKRDDPHIVYTDLGHGLIKYATRRNGKWLTEAVDWFKGAAGGQGYWDRDGIAVDSQGNPHVSYFDKGTGVLKVAHREGSRWMVETVDNNMSGMTSSLAIADGMLWVSYASLYEQSFKVANRPLTEAAQPTVSVQRGTGSVSKR